MSVAYVDSSALIAIAFAESRGGSSLANLLTFDRVIASNLLEAEVRSAFAREGLRFQLSPGLDIEWIFPDRPLTSEFARVLQAGYLRGADLWHVATALYVAVDLGEMFFVTLDGRQREVARTLGFAF